MSRELFDIVVPVHNSMHHVRACLESIFRHSTLPFRLCLIDDGSNSYTKAELAKLLERQPDGRCSLHSNARNMGYLKSCNFGVRSGNNPYVILLNSDAMVTEGYLERIRDDFESDPNIGVINAVSNWANWTRVPFPNGFTVSEMALEVRSCSTNSLPDLMNASGFFLAIRRDVFDQIGDFDEAFHPGYFEETDFCMRALKAGYRVVVDDGLYVFHYGWGSFGESGRNENMERNRRIFFSKWGKEFAKYEHVWKTTDPLKGLRNHLADHHLWMHKQRAPVENGAPNDENALCRRPLGTKKVRYILPAIKLYGGVVSVLQLVNNMVLSGVDANVVTYGDVDPEMERLLPMYFRPYVFKDQDEMIDGFPEADLVVATHYHTVNSAIQIAAADPKVKLAYFVQDFEPDFHTFGSRDYRQAERTYRMIPEQIVKTNWLKELLTPYGGNISIIPLGLQLDVFHPLLINRAKQVISMARPSNTYRNYSMLKAVYAELHRRRPDIELAVYGVQSAEDFGFPVKCYGFLTDMRLVARALNESTVLLDASTFQGFGRPGIEAMACGAAAVLTDTGGITEYAKHRYNCLLINPNDRDQIVEGIIEMFDDDALRSRLIERGFETSQRYSDKVEAEMTISRFRDILDFAKEESLHASRRCA